MSWKDRPRDDAQLGPSIGPEQLDRLVREHLLVLDAEQDVIAARIRERLGSRSPSAFGAEAGLDRASPAM